MEEDTYTLEAIKWLTSASEQEWLLFVYDSNYDFNPDVIRWMIRQERCTKPVALAIYWHMEPHFYCQYSSGDDVPEWARESYEIVKHIEYAYLAGQYSQASLGFDPRNDLASADGTSTEGYDWTKGVGVETCIPPVMGEPVLGERIDVGSLTRGWIEGLPPHVALIVFPGG